MNVKITEVSSSFKSFFFKFINVSLQLFYNNVKETISNIGNEDKVCNTFRYIEGNQNTRP